MQKEYAKKGVVILAISYEPASKVGPYVKKNKMNYIVGADGKEMHDAYGIKGYPTYFVVDAKGKIVHQGHDGNAAETAVKKALKDTPPDKDGFFAKLAGKDLEKADKLAKDGKYDKALKSYEKIAADHKGSKVGEAAAKKLEALKADPEVAMKIKDAEAAKKCKGWLQFARDAAKSGENDRARKYYERIIDEFPGTSFAKTAQEELDGLGA